MEVEASPTVKEGLPADSEEEELEGVQEEVEVAEEEDVHSRTV